MIKGLMANNSAPKGTAMDTLIGRQTEVTGDLVFAGGLHVDGRVRGNVTATVDKPASLSIAESGVVEGNVQVANIVINGRVTGDIHATERLVLGSKARVVGNVHYKVLQMEAGAMISGQLIYQGGDGAGIALVKSDAGKLARVA